MPEPSRRRYAVQQRLEQALNRDAGGAFRGFGDDSRETERQTETDAYLASIVAFFASSCNRQAGAGLALSLMHARRLRQLPEF
jgi:hypothetical protein